MNRTHRPNHIALSTRPPAARISRRAAALCVLLAALALYWGAPAATAQAQELKVGVVVFLSGPAAGPFGIPAQNGSQVVVDAINAGALPAPYNTGKGIAGMKVSTVFIDEAGGTAKQVEEYRNLVQRQGVNVVVGYISSGDCLAVAPVAEEMKTLTILGDCGTPRIFEDADYHYVFRSRPHATMDNVSAARYLLDLKPDLKTYAGINQNYAWGQDSWNDFTAAMKVLQPEARVTSEQFPKLFAGQFSSEISALLLTRSDAIHSSLWGGDLESFVFQATARGLDRRSLLVFTAGEPYMFRLGKSLPDGVIIGARGPYGLFAHKTPLNTWFRTEYMKRFNEPPVYASYVLGQSFLALKKAYETAQKAAGGKAPDQEQVIKALEHMEFEAFGSTVKMALGKGHQAVSEAAVGRFKFDEAKGESTLVDVKYYTAECTSPPEGVKSVDWILGGMKGAKCN
jgi:branched-chain amino acid transport system substrate-binding protein